MCKDIDRWIGRYANVNIYIFIYTYVYIYIYGCVCLCVYPYIFTLADARDLKEMTRRI